MTERLAVGSSRMIDARVKRDGARDGDRLLTAAGQALDPLVHRIDIDLEPLQHLVGLGIHFLAVDKPALHRPAAEKNILADIHVSAQGKILIDHLDANSAAFMRAAEIGGAAGHQDFAGIAVIGAGHDLHQRRFARRIVADQTQDFAGIKPEIDIAQAPARPRRPC